MKDFNSGELSITIEEKDDIIYINWIGKSRDRNPAEVLNPYFDELIEALKGRKVSMDFRNLNAMNSSTVPPIVIFIKKLEQNGIITEIFYDRKLDWQKASFRALETVIMQFHNISISDS